MAKVECIFYARVKGVIEIPEELMKKPLQKRKFVEEWFDKQLPKNVVRNSSFRKRIVVPKSQKRKKDMAKIKRSSSKKGAKT